MSKEYHYNRTGNERKAFVGIISHILCQPAIYQKAPTFAYKIGSYLVDKNGTLSYGDDANPEESSHLLAELQQQGYIPEEWASLFVSPSDEEASQLTITVPVDDLSDTAYLNLQKIINSKATLIELALGVDSLEIKVKDGKIHFPWFRLNNIPGEALAYSQLVTALVQMAKKQKRVTAREKPIENAKFSMRLFLIRLGFIGDEYKTARQILLRNLTGNSAWKAGQPPENRTETADVELTTSPVPTALETEIDIKKGGAPYEA